MKKALFLLFLVFLSSFVFAGTRYYMDLSEGSATIKVNERDLIEFKYLIREYEEPQIVNNKEVLKFFFNETTQRIMIDKVKPGSVDLTTFLAGSEVPYYATLDKATSLNLDLERDGLTDVKARLMDIDNKTVTLKFEDLVGGGNIGGGIGEFKKEVEEEVEEEKEEEVEEEVEPVDITGEITEAGEIPWFVRKLSDSWEVTSIVALIVLVLVWNKRGIRRFIRRNF